MGSRSGSITVRLDHDLPSTSPASLKPCWKTGRTRSVGVAHQTVALDIRALRDAQTPDATGNVIPREAMSGQFLWSVHGVELKSIVGRAEYADDALGVSSHYACYNCCGDSFVSGWITKFAIRSVTAPPSQSSEARAEPYPQQFSDYAD
ncbi:MAG: hypothetical protein NZ585_07210 [Chloracidobacterium sp.]|nr:hypothetical protein [Chloracidobacterium sp.]MDW8218479.1 hypothetical protein [Acidobacteriota bacterium]